MEMDLKMPYVTRVMSYYQIIARSVGQVYVSVFHETQILQVFTVDVTSRVEGNFIRFIV